MQCTICQTPLPEEARFCFSCGSGLTPDGAVTTVRSRDVTAELQERLAKVLEGRYIVRKLLGAGGMGAVFLADDLTLERQVAIKVLPPDLSRDERVVARFHREAKTAARLDHPNIIPIHRVESEAGLDYFVMRFVAGRPLDTMLTEGSPQPLAFATRILMEAAAALGHAHARGVIHRDVKPANIMLDAEDRVVLTDFGISKAGGVTAALTQTGVIVGTPYYMAPEQATGKDVDGRADQYALGVVGFELLTGKLPFDGDSAHTIIYRHVSEPPPRVSDLRPDTPPHLTAAIARALAKHADERFATMEEFVAAVGGERPQTRAPKAERRPMPPGAATVPLRPGRPTRRSRAWMIAASLCLTIAAAGGAGWWVTSGRAAAAPAGGDAVRANAGPTLGAAPSTSGAQVEQGAQAPDTQPSRPAPQESAIVAATDSVSTIETREPKPAPVPGRVSRREPNRPARTLRDAARTRRESTDETPTRAFAPLTVASEPYGTLFIDGVEIGDTPIANHPLPVGKRVELRVERDGYKTKREVVMVSGPNAIRRRYLLEPGEQP